MKYFGLLSFIMIILFLLGCEAKTSAFGELNDIIVVTDSVETIVIEDSIRFHFFPGRKMPVDEPSFRLKFVNIEDMVHYSVRRNLFIIGTLNGRNKMSAFLNKVLPENFKSSIRSGSMNFTWQNDLYSYNQNTLFFAAADMNSLISAIALRGEVVADLWKEKYREDLIVSMFEVGEQVDLEKYLLRIYGFTVRIQHDYFIADEEQEKNFIWMRRVDRMKEISRDIYIKYYENGDTIQLTREWLFEERTKLANAEFGREEEIVPEETITRDIYIGKYNAIKLEGTWRTKDLMIGGPFSMYSFYVPEQNRVYLIEGSVTAVGRRKTPYINQLEVIAESFRIQQSEQELKNN